jgi:NADP-dependent 3-hydroxy acid dehydrogenase YdfG
MNATGQREEASVMTKVLLITGASTGIGAATARAAAAAGWSLGLVARSAETLGELVQELGPERTLALPLDVADAEAQAAAVAALVGRFGRLDAAFANAGRGARQPGIEAGDLDDWRGMLDVNIWGLLVTCKVCLPELRRTKGQILLTGSRAGHIALKGSIYGATKWFVHGFAANLRDEMREWGGRCTVIAPGMTDTPFFDTAKPDKLKAEDVARAALYALDQPAHVTVGEVLLLPTNP